MFFIYNYYSIFALLRLNDKLCVELYVPLT
jgi:hypothetical protein